MTRTADTSPAAAVAWFPKPDQRRRYLQLLSPTFTCHVVRSPGELVHAVIDRRVACVLIDAPVDDSEQGLDLVRRLALHNPKLPVFILCASTPRLLRDVAAYVRAGATDVIFEAWEPLARTVQTALDQAGRSCALDEACACLAPLMSDNVHAIVRICLEHSRERVCVGHVAGRLGLHRNTIALRLSRARWPSCRRLIQWGRLIAAADELSSGAQSIERVALGLGFASGSGLAASFRRLAGLRRSELRTIGGEGVVRLLLTQLPPRPEKRSSGTRSIDRHNTASPS